MNNQVKFRVGGTYLCRNGMIFVAKKIFKEDHARVYYTGEYYLDDANYLTQEKSIARFSDAYYYANTKNGHYLFTDNNGEPQFEHELDVISEIKTEEK